MKEVEFAVDIRADRARVWDVLWQDATFRDWSGLIDPGTYMKGELKEGSEVEFISAVNGYGVTSLVDKLIDGEYVLLKHQADTQNNGQDDREKEWTGGNESYALAENGDVTTLTVAYDIPPSQEEYFAVHFPQALERIKTLAESS